MAANTTRAAKPMVRPISTCCANTISASGEFKATTGISGKVGCAATTISRPRPMRTRRGMARIDRMGAEVNKPITRKNGHSHGVIHAITWASLNVITTLQPTTLGIDCRTCWM